MDSIFKAWLPAWILFFSSVPLTGWTAPLSNVTAVQNLSSPPAARVYGEPPLDAPLRPTDRRLPGSLLSPGLDFLILCALAWWFWRAHQKRGREENLLNANYYGEYETQKGVLRAVVYPSERYAKELRRHRALWIEEFRILQYAWARHDLRPVYGIIGGEMRKELEVEAAHAPGGGKPAPVPQIVVRLAEPVDSWKEDGKEYVTVHFGGELGDRRGGGPFFFDEYWTFSRILSEFAAEDHSTGERAEANSPWVVTAISRGNRERSLPRAVPS